MFDRRKFLGLLAGVPAMLALRTEGSTVAEPAAPPLPDTKPAEPNYCASVYAKKPDGAWNKYVGYGCSIRDAKFELGIALVHAGFRGESVLEYLRMEAIAQVRYKPVYA